MSTETPEATSALPEGPSQKDLENALRSELVKQQDVIYAVVGGLASALVGAVIWATITVATNYQIGYMAIAVGLLVGFGVRFFGAGVDTYFGVIGALFALLSCALGNLLSQLVFAANQEGIEYFAILSRLNFGVISAIFKESFSPMDVVFYGFAAYEGFRFAFRKIEDELPAAVAAGKVNPPPFASLRLPVTIVLFIGLSVLGYFAFNAPATIQTYNYESGAVQAKGAIEGGRETGPWELWWENGKLQAKGSFKNGASDGEWSYYNEDGVMLRKGSYSNGLEEGEWIDYHADGSVEGKGEYLHGRQTGPWIYNYENGKMSAKGNFALDLRDGEWEIYYESGQLASKGTYAMGDFSGLWTLWYEDGRKREEVEYDVNGASKILNSWLEDGKAVIADGAGELKNVYDDGKVMEVGKVKGGYRDGLWKKFYADGKNREEGEYRDKIYYLKKAWTSAGDLQISDGTGTMETFYEDGSPYESGQIDKGLRTGKWTMNYSGMDQVAVESNFANGKLEGVQTSYAMDGYVQVQGAYVADKRNGEWKWFSSDGVIESVVTFVDGKKNGDQLFYNTYSDLLKTEVYKDGKLIETKVEE